MIRRCRLIPPDVIARPSRGQLSPRIQRITIMRLLLLTALAGFLALAVTPVSAQYSITWTNGTGNSLWSVPGNWDLHRVPTGKDAVHFGDAGLWGSGLVDLGGAIQDA